MKHAIFYSGQARTFSNCFYNQHWQVLRHLEDPEFFICVADDAQAPSMELLYKRFPKDKVHINIVKQPEFPESDFLEDKNLHSAYPRSSKMLSVLRAFRFYQEVWKMGSKRCFDEGATVVRIRPDLWFMDFSLPGNLISPYDCYTVPWGSFGGINDRFAVMGHVAADGYFNTLSFFQKLADMGCPLHPETMTKASVELVGGGCKQTLLADYRTRRLPDPNHAEKNNHDKEWYQFDPIGAYEMVKASLSNRQ